MKKEQDNLELMSCQKEEKSVMRVVARKNSENTQMDSLICSRDKLMQNGNTLPTSILFPMEQSASYSSAEIVYSDSEPVQYEISNELSALPPKKKVLKKFTTTEEKRKYEREKKRKQREKIYADETLHTEHKKKALGWKGKAGKVPAAALCPLEQQKLRLQWRKRQQKHRELVRQRKQEALRNEKTLQLVSLNNSVCSDSPEVQPEINKNLSTTPPKKKRTQNWTSPKSKVEEKRKYEREKKRKQREKINEKKLEDLRSENAFQFLMHNSMCSNPQLVQNDVCEKLSILPPKKKRAQNWTVPKSKIEEKKKQREYSCEKKFESLKDEIALQSLPYYTVTENPIDHGQLDLFFFDQLH